MKFFHVGDLHFGKMFYNISLVETDQSYWVNQFIRAVDDYNPDAVVISGDIYDRRDPSPEAMQLFAHLITELAERNKYVFIIPGNHDSAIRLSHVNRLLKTHKIYIAGELEKELMHITVPGETTDVTFWLMPYIFPKLVSDKKVLNREKISSYDDAARQLLAAQKIDSSNCNVLVAHQNVVAGGVTPEHSESESIIGGLGEIDYSAFDIFDYVALGHIHNAQSVGRKTVRYSGCPLYYDFSEINRNKQLTMVNIDSKNDISIELIDIDIMHRLLQVTGTLEELLPIGAALENKSNYYIQCILCDKHIPPRAIEQLRDVYGEHLLNVKRSLSEFTSYDETSTQAERISEKSIEEQFAVFYQEQQDELLDEVQETLVRRIFDQQSRQSGEYISDFKNVSEADSQELLDLLLQITTEENI